MSLQPALEPWSKGAGGCVVPTESLEPWAGGTGLQGNLAINPFFFFRDWLEKQCPALNKVYISFDGNTFSLYTYTHINIQRYTQIIFYICFCLRYASAPCSPLRYCTRARLHVWNFFNRKKYALKQRSIHMPGTRVRHISLRANVQHS